MEDERQDSLREEQRRMGQGPYPFYGEMETFGGDSNFTWTGILASVVVVLLMLGAGIFLLSLVR
jgi:hypothetical protein